MMNRILLIFMLLINNSTVFANANSANTLWMEANKAYKQKQYEKSIDLYQALLKHDKKNAEVYYNLGNAYYRANKVSEAALNYERALFYQPQLSQAKDNLILAQNRIPNSLKKRSDIFFLRWWNALTKPNMANTWAILALFFFVIPIIILFLKSSRNISFFIPTQSYFIAAFFVVLFLILGFNAAQNAKYSDHAVVMNEGAVLLVAPNNYKAQSIVPEATTVIISDSKNNWYSVSLPDKRIGWMKKSDLQLVKQ